MSKRKNVFGGMGFCIGVTVGFFLVNLMLVVSHEQYYNEANQWQIAKHASLTELPEILKTEGHPILWYLLLMPLAKLGLPFVSANLVSLVIMSVAVFLFVKYAPFKKVTLVMVVCSVAFMYFLPVIARNYCLVALGVVIVGITYKERLSYPIRYGLGISLLLQSHILVAGLAGVLGAVFVWEWIRQKKIGAGQWRMFGVSVGIIIMSLAVLVLCLWGSTSAHGYLKPTRMDADLSYEKDVVVYLNSLGQALFGVDGAWIWIGIFFVGIIILFSIKYPKQAIILLVACSYQAVVLMYLYTYGRYAQDALNVLYLVLCIWMTMCEKPRGDKIVGRMNKVVEKFEIAKLFRFAMRPSRETVLACVCLLTVPNVWAHAYHDMTGEFSMSRAVVNYINDNLPENSVIVVGNEHELMVAIAPNLRSDIRLYDAVQDKDLKYIIYDAASSRKMEKDELLGVMADFVDEKETFFVANAWRVDDDDVMWNEKTVEIVNELELVKGFTNKNVGAELVKNSLEQYWGIYKIP
jgi:hypothetical protein